MIYQAFFAFILLGTNATEDAFYANLAQQPEVLKSVLLFIAVLLGDALVVGFTFHKTRIPLINPLDVSALDNMGSKSTHYHISNIGPSWGREYVNVAPAESV